MKLPINFPLLGNAQQSCAADIWRLCSHYHIINKQKIHQGLIKGLYSTEGEREENVFVSRFTDEVVLACF